MNENIKQKLRNYPALLINQHVVPLWKFKYQNKAPSRTDNRNITSKATGKQKASEKTAELSSRPITASYKSPAIVQIITNH